MSNFSPETPRVLLLAFQGWGDAGEAASEALQHLAGLMDVEPLHVIGAEGYVDFQGHRPRIIEDIQGNRTLEWPDTRLYGPIERPGAIALPGTAPAADDAEPRDAAPADDEPMLGNGERVRRIDGSPVKNLFLLAGFEPAYLWQSFADEIVELIETWAIDTVIFIGSMYSDAPHSRPIATTITSENEGLRSSAGAERSTYEGPAGIGTIIELALKAADIPALSLWAQIPHYVHSSPSPKATLALLDKLEELLDIVIPRGELLSQSNEWEENINRIASSDDEMVQYIRGLEQSRDEAMAAEATGDALAMEFEKFLGRNVSREDVADDTETGDVEGDDTESGDADSEEE